jgi:DNA-binding MurR/RpiR family transcriptional regulator
VKIAHEQGLTIISLSDSPASPIFRQASHAFTLAVDSPQFFPSSVSIIAVLETLLSLVIAVASDEIVDRVDRFHQRRHDLGLYVGDAT